MFKLLKHKLNVYKCNPSNVIYQVDQFNENILNPLSSNKEGIYGIEMAIQKDSLESYIIAPSHYIDIEGTLSECDYDMLQHSLDYLHCYTIEFQQPSFLPLGESDFPLWDYLQQLSNSKVDLFVQLLLHNSNKDWMDTFIDQYVHYIKGNDYPLANKLGRNIQSKLLHGVNKLTKFDIGHNRNPHIEYKIKDHGYRFSLRLILHSQSEKLIRLIENEIQEILSTMDFFNQLKLYKDKDKETFIDHYANRVMNIRTNEILSETELMCLFMGGTNTVTTTQKQTVTNTKQYNTGLDLLPKNEETAREIDESIGERIVDAIRELGLAKNKHINILDQSRSATLNKVTIKIPNGVKYTDVKKNEEDIKAILGYDSFIIEPGEQGGTISFYMPSDTREIIYLRNLLESQQFQEARKDMMLPVVIGLDTLGEIGIIDLAKLPHLLIGATTGGGKSYFLNCIILTLLLFKKPNELKLYLIDPKKVEFKIYKGFQHVGNDVVTDVKSAVLLLQQICEEMDRRYDEFSKVGVRNISIYNEKFPKNKLPYIVTIIDELSDLMMVSKGEVEDYVVRLAQLARASGIHIIIATQRPTVDVVTGLIKANIEARIAFSVSSGTDSRVILDEIGAEHLLGKGDGYAKKVGLKKPLTRFQSPVISTNESEIEDIIEEMKMNMNGGKMVNNDTVMEENGDNSEENEQDPKEKLMEIILSTGEFRIKELQQLMNVSINKVNALMIELLSDGFLVRDGRGYRLNDE